MGLDFAEQEEELDLEAGLAGCIQLSLSTKMQTTAVDPKAHLNVCGFSMNLHAATTVDGRDRKRLERLCRCLVRPPFAQDAIQRLEDGRVRLRLLRRGTHLDMSGHQFLAKLIAQVPPPGVPMVRYAGAFSNAHHLRKRVVPEPEQVEQKQLALFTPEGKPWSPLDQGLDDRPRRIAWAKLLARVFAIDVETCSRCGGRLRITAAVVDPDAIAAALRGARAPPAPSPPGQLPLLH